MGHLLAFPTSKIGGGSLVDFVVISVERSDSVEGEGGIRNHKADRPSCSKPFPLAKHEHAYSQSVYMDLGFLLAVYLTIYGFASHTNIYTLSD